MPQRPFATIAYALLIWLTGFVWGSIVFMTPSLKSIAPIPYVSSNPAISAPIWITWLFLSYFLAKSYLKRVDNKAAEGLKLGLTFTAVNIVLDLIVLVFLLSAGFGYFLSLSVLSAYLMLTIVPLLTGRSAIR